jgi:hypothetical protein
MREVTPIIVVRIYLSDGTLQDGQGWPTQTLSGLARLGYRLVTVVATEPERNTGFAYLQQEVVR